MMNQNYIFKKINFNYWTELLKNLTDLNQFPPNFEHFNSITSGHGFDTKNWTLLYDNPLLIDASGFNNA